LWNELAEREAFTLFCGYSTVQFGDPRSGSALRHICQLHLHVHVSPRDILGSFLPRRLRRSTHSRGKPSSTLTFAGFRCPVTGNR
jgi:hypothetical protein